VLQATWAHRASAKNALNPIFTSWWPAAWAQQEGEEPAAGRVARMDLVHGAPARNRAGAFAGAGGRAVSTRVGDAPGRVITFLEDAQPYGRRRRTARGSWAGLNGECESPAREGRGTDVAGGTPSGLSPWCGLRGVRGPGSELRAINPRDRGSARSIRSPCGSGGLAAAITPAGARRAIDAYGR